MHCVAWIKFYENETSELSETQVKPKIQTHKISDLF